MYHATGLLINSILIIEHCVVHLQVAYLFSKYFYYYILLVLCSMHKETNHSADVIIALLCVNLSSFVCSNN